MNKLIGNLAFVFPRWWHPAPKTLVQPTLEMIGMIELWHRLTKHARDGRDSSPALLKAWESILEATSNGLAFEISERFTHVEVFFCNADPPALAGRWWPSWHQWATEAILQVDFAVCDIRECLSTPVDANALAEHVRQESNRIKERIGLAMEGQSDEISDRLERECKQAWLEWRRLPEYATDPAAAERFTDEEVETIGKAVRAEERRKAGRELRAKKQLGRAAEVMLDYFYGDWTDGKRSYQRYLDTERNSIGGKSTLADYLKDVKGHLKTNEKPTREQLENLKNEMNRSEESAK